MQNSVNIPLTPEKDFINQTKIGGRNPFFLIAGPCVIENEKLLETVAQKLKELSDKYGILIFFKSSFDKANRSSIESFRGPGLVEGLKMLAEIKKQYKLPLVTDIHLPDQIEKAAEVVDMLQIPAFLSRQTDILVESAKSGCWVNVKKGQFMAPLDALKIIEKFHSAGSDKVTICERGYTFGYNNLVTDMRSFEMLRKEGVHMVMDATHATQLPGGGLVSGGQREMAYPLARAAVATGLEGLFMEVHPDPPKAKSDATNQLYLEHLENILIMLQKIDQIIKQS